MRLLHICPGRGSSGLVAYAQDDDVAGDAMEGEEDEGTVETEDAVDDTGDAEVTGSEKVSSLTSNTI